MSPFGSDCLPDWSEPPERLCTLGGGGSGGSGSTVNPTVFLPPGQGQAAQDFGQILQPWANTGANTVNQMAGFGSPYGNAYASSLNYAPSAQNLVEQYLTGSMNGGPNTPYSQFVTDALGQGQAGYNYGASTLFPNAQAGAGALQQAGMNTLNLPTGLWDQNLGIADSVYNTTAGMAPQFFNQAMAPAGQILSSAFDPQGALYDQQLGQATDASSVANAIAGTAGSPYAASNTANALNNFNVGWQNNLLNREATGGQAYSNLANAALGGFEGLTNTGVGAYNSLTGGAVNDLSSLYGIGSGLLSGANTLGASGANTANSLAYTPYQFGSNIAGGALSGLSNLAGLQGNIAGLGQNAYNLPQQAISDLMQYMGLGQSASSLNNQLTNSNFMQNAASAGGLLSGANSLFGNNSLLGGSSGIFGSGGLLGSLGLGGGEASSLGLSAGAGAGADLSNFLLLAGLPFGA